MPSNLQVLGQVINNNVKQISKSFDIVNNWFWKKLIFAKNYLIMARMAKALTTMIT